MREVTGAFSPPGARTFSTGVEKSVNIFRHMCGLEATKPGKPVSTGLFTGVELQMCKLLTGVDKPCGEQR